MSNQVRIQREVIGDFILVQGILNNCFLLFIRLGKPATYLKAS